MEKTIWNDDGTNGPVLICLPPKREYQPKTGAKCSCKRGQRRDNCPDCEGTGMRIDFAAIRRGAA